VHYSHPLMKWLAGHLPQSILQVKSACLVHWQQRQHDSQGAEEECQVQLLEEQLSILLLLPLCFSGRAQRPEARQHSPQLRQRGEAV